MRIVAGNKKGVRLTAPSGREIRPTSDRVREAMFQIAESRYGIVWAETLFLDLFSGAGTLGLEAVSRGAVTALFVESSRRHIRVISANIAKCKMEERCKIIRAFLPMSERVVSQVAYHGPFGMIVADPPYSKGLGAKTLLQTAKFGLLAENGLMVIEGFFREHMPKKVKEEKSSLELCDMRRYGQTGLWFYARY